MTSLRERGDYQMTLWGCLTRYGTDPFSLDRTRLIDTIMDAIHGISGGALELATTDLTGSLRAVLEIPIDEILEGAVNEIWQDSKKENESETGVKAAETIPLLNFTIESEHTPKLNVYCNTKRVLQVTLNIVLTLQVSGAKAVLRHGHIDGLQTGSCSGRVSLGLQNAGEVVEIGAPEFDLPGEISFVKNVEKLATTYDR